MIWIFFFLSANDLYKGIFQLGNNSPPNLPPGRSTLRIVELVAAIFERRKSVPPPAVPISRMNFGFSVLSTSIRGRISFLIWIGAILYLLHSKENARFTKSWIVLHFFDSLFRELCISFDD